jgi:DNA/RNA endonuclease YhcR with UshA esterase domain
MKRFAFFAVVIGLMAGVGQSRADDTNTVPLIIGSAQVTNWIGKQVTVTGVVAQVSIRPSLVFLNIDKSFPSNLFTVIVRNKNTNEFEGLPALRGKVVSVSGEIKDYRGKPEMELSRKSQLKVLSESK